MKTHTAVILFRDNSESDVYTEMLQEDHDIVESIAVLDHKNLLTEQNLQDVVDSRNSFSAIIFSSQNAVKALSQKILASAKRKQLLKFINSRPIFVVGKATASACYKYLSSTADIRGAGSGCAAALLPKILEFGRENTGKLLFFCGNQRRDTLPDGIRQSKLAPELAEITTYSTSSRDTEHIRQELAATMHRIKHNSTDLLWLVLFSPSGVRTVMPLLLECSEIRSRFVAIGSTTLAAITEKPLTCPHVTAADVVMAHEPTAKGIRNAITQPYT